MKTRYARHTRASILAARQLIHDEGGNVAWRIIYFTWHGKLTRSAGLYTVDTYDPKEFRW